jgi:hypothetical protein
MHRARASQVGMWLSCKCHKSLRSSQCFTRNLEAAWSAKKRALHWPSISAQLERFWRVDMSEPCPIYQTLSFRRTLGCNDTRCPQKRLFSDSEHCASQEWRTIRLLACTLFTYISLHLSHKWDIISVAPSRYITIDGCQFMRFVQTAPPVVAGPAGPGAS